MRHITIAHLKLEQNFFFANSSFLIFRTANRNGKALSDPKGAAYEAYTGVREVKTRPSNCQANKNTP
jgi:hypothetical protein